MTEHNHNPEEIKQSVVVENGSGGNWAVPISILIAALIIAGAGFYNNKKLVEIIDEKFTVQTQGTGQQAQGAAQAPTGPVKITLKDDAPFLGNKDAKVVVVEYADYQCPFCEKWFKEVYPQLKSKYIDTGKIKFVFQDFAFLGPDSTTAAEAAQCAKEQGKFWQYHDYLFSNQGPEHGGWAKAENQKNFAKAMGLNTSKFNSCLDTHKYAQEVQNQTAAGKSYGVTGTPTTFVNGKIFVGAQPFSTFEQAIEAELK
jgi:protein-disulfide isomerase